MLVIGCAGGLGNQMFQYAFYFKQKLKNNRCVKFDISSFNNYKQHNGFELDKIFDLDIDYATRNDIRESGKALNSLDRIKNKLLLKKRPYYSRKPYEAITFFPEMEKLKDGYYFGYWQSQKYFEDISEKVRTIFRFKDIDEDNNYIYKKILNNNSVSIHIRRGDYLNSKNKIFQNICTEAYYKNAVNYINEHIENPKYYVFSNDIGWCKSNLDIKSVEYIDWNTGDNSYRDMQLMSYCKHNIIANSSFSWWGAWLNKNPAKIVCVPERWFNSEKGETIDVCPSEWIRMQIE